MSNTTINSQIESLTAHFPRVIDLSLKRVEQALQLLDNPHLKVPPIIHIAGTNGKGSTGAFCRSILEVSGKKVHVYTSPHLVCYNERIRLAGKLVDDETLLNTFSEVIETCKSVQLTIFELITISAFLLFSRIPADILILEVGLGGRLDATNVIIPAVSVITAISIDHTQFLGDTLTQIAQEKAGIIKRKTPVIIGRQEEEVEDVLIRIAERNFSPMQMLGEEFGAGIEEGRFVYQAQDVLYDCTPPKLTGLHQIDNAAMAISAVNCVLKTPLENDIIEQGLANAHWPARMQRLKKGKLIEGFLPNAEVWLDGGHNAAAGEVLAAILADMDEHNPKPIVLIVGMLNTKDPAGFFSAFEGLVQNVLSVQIPDEPNALSAVELASHAKKMGLKAAAMPSFEQALHAAAEVPNARVVICGSLYLAGYVLAQNGAELV